jgi:hypothetical protein
VHDRRMQSTELIMSGPYRFVRNPLYLGGWCMIGAISLLMPPTGALFAILLVTSFYLRLIFAEEAFLQSRLGEIYSQYRRQVPRIIPRLRTSPPRSSLPSSKARPQWLVAASTQLISIGVFFTLAALAWTYDNLLMIKAIVVSFGISLVAQAFTTGKTKPVENDSGPA